jgi:hypothetical protein
MDQDIRIEACFFLLIIGWGAYNVINHIKSEGNTMGKRKLLISMATGAIVGGLISLFDKETRNYTKGKLSNVKSTAAYAIKNPSEAVHQLQDTFDAMSEKFTTGTESAINAFDQVQQTLGKIENKTEGKEIE